MAAKKMPGVTCEAGAVGDHMEALVVVERHQDQREHEHAKDLEHHAGVVDQRDQPDAVDVQHGDHRQGDQGEDEFGVQGKRQAVPAEAVEGRNERQWQRGNHRGHRQDSGEEVNPAGDPRITPGAQVLGPLEYRAGDRIVARHLGEVERDDELAEGHHGPGPDEYPAQGGQPEREQREDAGRGRDVAERDCPRAEQAQPALQFLLVAETSQVGRIGLRVAGDTGAGAHPRILPLR